MNFHYSVKTTKSVDEAVQALEQSLKEYNFGILWQLDIPSKLREKGVDFDIPYRVLEVCNPHEAKRVLSQNTLVGYFLPCKIVVYQEEGETTIGMPKPTVFMSLVNDETLKPIAEEVENNLARAIDAAAR